MRKKDSAIEWRMYSSFFNRGYEDFLHLDEPRLQRVGELLSSSFEQGFFCRMKKPFFCIWKKRRDSGFGWTFATPRPALQRLPTRNTETRFQDAPKNASETVSNRFEIRNCTPSWTQMTSQECTCAQNGFPFLCVSDYICTYFWPPPGLAKKHKRV